MDTPSFFDLLAPGRFPTSRPGPGGLPPLRERIRHDLQMLLNARCGDAAPDGTPWPTGDERGPNGEKAAFADLATSGFLYGLRESLRSGPAVVTGGDGRAGWQPLAEHIECVIRHFEPRLRQVRVRPKEPPRPATDEGIRREEESPWATAVTMAYEFVITAHLVGDDGDEETFTSTFTRGTGLYTVT